VPKAEREEGDPELHALFERFNAQVVSPGGAAALLGLSRKTIYTLGQRKRIRVFHSSTKDKWSETGARWTYIPIIDLAQYADEVGRPFPTLSRERAEAAEREAAELGLTGSDDSPTMVE
jgi:hypothetical protein